MRSSIGASLVVICLASQGAPAADVTVNFNSKGTPFSTGVRGMAAPALNITRGEYTVGIPKTLEVSKGTSIRGYAGGLEAELFNWKTRNNDARPSSLQYQRYARDNDAEMVFTANMRGLAEPDPNSPGMKRFYDTSTSTLSSLAADWVRYTNRITQVYRQGDNVTDTRDKAILNSLVWSSATPGDTWPTLPSKTEKPVPKVKYWEIGNEPRVSLAGAYQVDNSYTFTGTTGPSDYAARYVAMTSAMRAEDSTIKVGPCLQGLSTETSIIDAVLSNPNTPVDFISYHPYQKLNLNTTAAAMETGLRGVYTGQKASVDFLRGRMTANGRDPSKIELLASEINVSDWRSNDTTAEATMAHALGSVETVFSFARLGVHASHYWIWPAHRFDGTEYPVFKAYEGLRDHMGDTLLNVYENNNTRVYTTRDHETGEMAVWGLNFSDTTDAVVNLSMGNLGPGPFTVRRYTLGALTGETSLFTSNLSSDMAGGPTHAVDWTSVDLNASTINFNNFNLTLQNATITVLVIQGATSKTIPEPGSGALITVSLLALCARRCRRA